MRILHLSDLHIDMGDSEGFNETSEWIVNVAARIDIVVITGDIFEYVNYRDDNFNPHRILSEMFVGLPVVCTLGNHEFFKYTTDDARKLYSDWYMPDKYNVHYLDIIGHYDVGNIRFVGNWLCYDGSMKTVHNQDLYQFAGGCWADKHIKNFDYRIENNRCVEQIDANLKEGAINVLCTHCTPHYRLNSWYAEDKFVGNEFNAYSGIHDFLVDRQDRINMALCGHTHRREVCGIYGIECYNPGNDYSPPYHHCLIEI